MFVLGVLSFAEARPVICHVATCWIVSHTMKSRGIRTHYPLERHGFSQPKLYCTMVNTMRGREILRSNPQGFVDGDVCCDASPDNRPVEHLTDLPQDMLLVHQAGLNGMAELAGLCECRRPEVHKESRAGDNVVVRFASGCHARANQIDMRSRIEPRTAQDGLGG